MTNLYNSHNFYVTQTTHIYYFLTFFTIKLVSFTQNVLLIARKTVNNLA